VVLSEISLVRARNPTGTDDLVNDMGAVSEGRSLLEVSSTDVSLGFGAMWLPSRKARFGISYQIKPGFGEQRLEGTLENKFGTAPESEGPVELRQRLPDILRFGAEFRASDKVKLRFGIDWQRWSSFENQCLIDLRDAAPECRFREDGSLDVENGGSGVVVNLPRDWKDTIAVRAGAWNKASDKLGFGGSVTYDSSAVPDETMDPSLFDMNKLVFQAGGRYVLSQSLFLSATVAHVYYMSRTVEPRTVDPVEPSRNPDMAGTYSSAVTFALLGLGVSL
jgi:long-chain fatty acid transport protein